VRTAQTLILRFLCLIAFPAALTLVTFSESRANDLVFKSQSVTIHYADSGQLEAFARKIRAGAFTLALNKVLVGSVGESNQTELGGFLDQLLKRVQLVLDMPMPKITVEIQIHKNVREVAETYSRLAGGSSNAPAFYWKKTNTIHIQTDNLTTGMLAHEMGHAILDRYFAIQPPTKIAEMLCQYVDKEISAGNF
jgi:hypothetical protein